MLSAVKAVTRSLVSVGAGTTMLLTAAAPADAAIGTESTRVVGISPARDTTVGVAHPVVVRFIAPVTDRAAAQRSLRITTLPPMSGRFDWVEDDAVHWVPDELWPSHSTVSVSIRGVSTEFRTGPAVLGVADTSAHTFTVTVDGVEAGPRPPLPAPHHRPYRGKEGVFPASMGSEDYPTPPGKYTVLAKDRSVLMDSTSVGIPITAESGYRFEVDHAVRISSRGLFVHSAPWALRSMGVENISHGCVGLSPTDAEWYFDTVRVGDPVIVK